MLLTAEIVALGIEGVLSALHISVVFVVIMQLLARNRGFSIGFYSLYLVQAVADSTSYLLVRWLQTI